MKETRFYAISVDTDIENIDLVEDEDFMKEAEKQGHVWSVKGFADELNHDHFNSDNYWIRAIEAGAESVIDSSKEN